MSNQPPHSSIPTTWPALIAAERDISARAVSGLTEEIEEFAALETSWDLASRFGGPALILSKGVILHGAAFCRPLLEPLLPSFARAVQAMERELATDTSTPTYLIIFANVAHCCGFALPSNVASLEQRWLPALVSLRTRLDEFKRQSLALAAVATGMPDLVPTLIGGGVLLKTLRAGEVFEFNAQGFIRYLATAVNRGTVAPADIEPAWLSFVNAFPHKLAAGTLGWHDLLLAGRTVLGTIQGQPIESVGDAVHALVSTLGTP